jgi:hypothetical protein
MSFDPTTLTSQDFKNQFIQGFIYIPNWSNLNIYNINDIVFYIDNNFYQCQNNNVTSVPGISIDWIKIPNIGYVADAYILAAYQEAMITYNIALFITDANAKLGFLYLAAHYLVYDSNAGGLNSTGSGILNSKSVKDVSVGYDIPDWMKKPVYSFYISSKYGLKYLNMIQPRLIGNMGSVWGGTNP